MKHKIKISIILLTMFLITQFIGLYVVNYYSAEDKELPYGMQTPEIEKESDYYSFFTSILIAFVIAISLLFLFTKLKLELILKLWFFFVVIVALSISLNSFLSKFAYYSYLAIAIAIPLAYIKIFKKNFLVHNSTELLIYPGIAAVFVPILNIYTIIALLILISLYDMWAVWHSGIMQKMAKYQINKLNIFGGFFVPYADKKTRQKIKLLKEKYKNKKTLEKNLKSKKISINIAMLGGGDIIFPIIAAGVVLSVAGLTSALFVTAGATLGLASLFIFSEKKKFYPAMPFITAGIFLGMLVGYLSSL